MPPRLWVPPRVARLQLPPQGSATAAIQALLGDAARVVSPLPSEHDCPGSMPDGCRLRRIARALRGLAIAVMLWRFFAAVRSCGVSRFRRLGLAHEACAGSQSFITCGKLTS
jgi:hypothetical protein